MIQELERLCENPSFDRMNAKKLLQAVDINQDFLSYRLKVRTTLLASAVFWANLPMVELLLECGADPNLIYDDGQETVLWDLQYCERDPEENKIRLQITERLLQNGADPHIRLDGEDLLHWAGTMWYDDEGMQEAYRWEFICLLNKYDK